MARSNSRPLSAKEKLVGAANFERWFSFINCELKSRHVLDVGTGRKPKDSCKTVEERILWMKKDIISQRVIALSVDKTVMIHIIQCKSGGEMYQQLVTNFGRDVKITDDTLGKFFNLSYCRSTGYDRYFLTLDKLIARLANNGVDLSDNIIIRKVLISLPSCYVEFLKDWMTAAEKDSYEALRYKCLLNDPEFRPVSESGRPVGKACYICASPYHNALNCLKTYTYRKPRIHFANGRLKYGNKKYFETSDAKKRGIQPFLHLVQPRCKICKKDNHASRNCYFRPRRLNERENPSSAPDQGGHVFTVSTIPKSRRPCPSRSGLDDISDL